MWALTLRQPWAWMVVHGTKDIENRSWVNKIVFELQRSGEAFAVHAGVGMTAQEYAEAVAFAAEEDPALRVPHKFELRFGQVIGTCRIECVFERDGVAPPENVSSSPFVHRPPGSERVRWRMPGKFGWKLKDRKKLSRPMYVKGKQGFWKLNDELVENAWRVE